VRKSCHDASIVWIAKAHNQERRRIMLLDLRRLFDLWVEQYGKIPEAQRQFCH